MKNENRRSSRGFTVLVGLVYLLLIVALGLILLKLYNTPSAEELLAVTIPSEPKQGQVFEMVETQPMTVGNEHELEAQPYDPWTNRPVVNSPRMPAGAEPPEPNPIYNLPPALRPPFEFSTMPPVDQPSSGRSGRCCRCVRINAVRIEGTPAAFPQSKGLQETTLPITNQP